MTESIETITLQRMLPAVFRADHPKESDIWLTELLLHKGKRYLVTAESGAGKSSFCSFIYGARRDFDGSLLFNGKDTQALKMDDWQPIRRENLAYLPQDLMLFPELTAMENILLKNDLTGAVTMSRIEQWLRHLGVYDRKDYPAGKMSVGQQQRVALVRALSQPFDFLLLDEPVSHLDEENNRKAAALVEQRATELGAAVVSTSVGNPLLLSDAIVLNL